MRNLRLTCALALFALAACHTPPPRPWLRYELDGVTDWQRRGPGAFGGRVHGVDVAIDLYASETRMLVTVDNRSEAAVTARLGPDAGGGDGAIGEVLLRQASTAPVGGPDMRAYLAMQPLTVERGWRATFYLDRPLGRDPKLGQYFVFAVDLENAAGERERHLLPVVAKMGGTMPAEPR